GLNLRGSGCKLALYGTATLVAERDIHANRSPVVERDTRRHRFAHSDRSCFPACCEASRASLLNRVVPVLLRSRHWPCSRSLQASAGINVPDAAFVGRFSGDTHWPVFGDR